MLDSRHKPASGKGTPVQVRDGPAAVWGDALPPRRHWVATWEGGGRGSPESEDLSPAANPNPSRQEDSCNAVSSQSSRLLRPPPPWSLSSPLPSRPLPT